MDRSLKQELLLSRWYVGECARGGVLLPVCSPTPDWSLKSVLRFRRCANHTYPLHRHFFFIYFRNIK